ncbi:hypothetical protein B5M10_05280 [Pluralibacter gergoviae]|uniref:glycosyltransferase family A protein n=1 Tax=Pluralibacter gergoviae TaxID=61647 RepID=UPI000907F405|nr:glycosyltransferase family A protein [Pluralibacter gergoviae]ELG9929437.1 glycosyltransferase family 2 protein [Pluralibacter gergoviae]ELK5591840.1 glycosyltransferase family 2 protein [Pluralibacter gergoviae]MDU4432661.1 glycosyltransferase family A protein [Pluralibacter gergoviae]OUR03703.1 hypothetical protein B5M10_05280 [Pluralibacter gergoviae]HDS1234507.1 glycosyltransferase family 2 protein [Pluralibacter gergoviae]
MIIINLTTTSNRLELCSATLWSLVNQNRSDYIIQLWISEEPYLSDDGIKSTLEFVFQLNRIKDIIKVKVTPNTGPYRKLLPCLRECKDEDIIVYVDDDVIYGGDWLTTLITEFEKNNSQCVVASRVREYKKNIFGVVKGYRFSKVITMKRKLKSDFIITGVGGVILKKKFINDSYIYSDDFLELAPKTDDVWFTKLFSISDTSVIACPEAMSQIYELSHNNQSLCSQNTTSSKRMTKFTFVAKLWNYMLAYFGIPVTNNDYAKKKVDIFFRS